VSFYSDMAATAVELLKEFGQAITLGSVTTGAYSAETGSVTNTVTNHAGFGAVFDYAQRDIDGTVIKKGDRRLYIAPNIGAIPKTGDTVTLSDGAKLTVVLSSPLAPAGTVLLHDVQLRGL